MAKPGHQVARDLAAAADAVASRYAQAPARETEAALAVLALWALEAVESGRLAGDEADRVFTELDVRIGDADGPELSDAVGDLVAETEHFHHWGGEWGTDPNVLRELAYAILEQREPNPEAA